MRLVTAGIHGAAGGCLTRSLSETLILH